MDLQKIQVGANIQFINILTLCATLEQQFRSSEFSNEKCGDIVMYNYLFIIFPKS